MSTFSSVPAYLAGALCIGLGVNGMIHPAAEYPRFGLPLEGSPERGAVSPLIYLKGVRETTYGLCLVALQYQNQETAITTVAAVVSLAALSDGFVVWSAVILPQYISVLQVTGTASSAHAMRRMSGYTLQAPDGGQLLHQLKPLVLVTEAGSSFYFDPATTTRKNQNTLSHLWGSTKGEWVTNHVVFRGL
ncbi:hypothetical protein PISL3812_01983 [Talaromyces islandicus]|uniref:Uncharacterized protein n=1 Tax=Talaromyces islandicus TaxID=28573 RepID=A0A0U1LP94_TALIS|nr:hypothetical protein PISL3812_01983 [Talaromyces islandicus]